MMTQQSIQEQLSKGKPYTVVFLTKGKKFILDKDKAEAMRNQHFGHLFQMRSENKVLVTFGTRENGFVRSIEVYASSDTSEVERLVKQDPGVVAEHFAYEIHLMTGLPGDMLR